MNHPSLDILGLLRADSRIAITVSPHWACDHAVLIECGLADLDVEAEDAEGGLEIIFEPDFSLDDDQAASEAGDDIFVAFEADDEEEDEDDWPP